VKIKDKLGIGIFGLVVFSLLLAVNCAKDGTAPEANIPPNTNVGPFSINNTPEEGTTLYAVNINWGGSDMDGAIYWYEWKIIADTGDSLFLYDYETDESGDTVSIDTTNISVWQITQAVGVSLILDFPTWEYSYTFEVRAQDNDREYDPTPISSSISLARAGENSPPQTTLINPPPNGSATGQGIYFSISGDDDNGTVEYFQYRVDDGDWTDVPAVDNAATFIIRDLEVGARIIYFRAVDNYGAIDPTLESVSIIVDDTFAPEIVLDVVNNQSFIVPFTEPILTELVVSFEATIDFYYSAIDSFRIVTSAGEDSVTTDITYTFENLASGAYWIDVTAYDIGGNSTSTGHINFNVVELAGSDGVLCVNGDDWATYSEAADLWENGVPWGAREHFKCWDLMGDATAGDDFADSLLGSGSIPTWMIDTTFFDAISWMWNSYAGDDAFWWDADMQTAIMAYLDMGGNVLIAGRFAQLIFEGDESTADFAAYCGYDSATVGVNPDSAVAVDDSVSNMTRNGSHSLSDLVHITHDHATQLFEMPDGTPGLGWVVTPNEAGGGGAVCFIGGRNYRWTNADLKGNIDVVLRYFFGIEN